MLIIISGADDLCSSPVLYIFFPGHLHMNLQFSSALYFLAEDLYSFV
jgi:hypothetical protein